MLKGIIVQLYPNQKQRDQMITTMNHCRWLWNELLEMMTKRYLNNRRSKFLSTYDLQTLLPTLKKEHVWLKQADSTALQAVCVHLVDAYERFFDPSLNNKRPKFKSRKHHATYKYTSINNSHSIQLEKNRIKLPKLGWVKARWSSNLSFEKIKRASIKYLPTGDFQASVLVESESQALAKTGQAVGFDFGVSDLAIGSDSTRHKTCRYPELERKRLIWEHNLARRRRLAKEKGIKLSDAKNYQKAKQKVAQYHQKIANKRKDYLHKVSKQMVETYDLIVMEKLDTANLLKNHTLAKAIANQSWTMLSEMITYKAEMYGRQVDFVSPYKTSQICSACDHDDGKHALSIREWTCPNCHGHDERDINAARNILSRTALTI